MTGYVNGYIALVNQEKSVLPETVIIEVTNLYRIFGIRPAIVLRAPLSEEADLGTRWIATTRRDPS
jgi:hypothetical protein